MPRRPSIAESPPVAIAIAGFDPSSGAGITADLKTFAAFGLYGISCPTALTVQSTRGVRQVVPIDPKIIAATLACLAADIPASGIKIGMLATGANADAVADYLETTPVPRNAIVLDPVLSSSSGSVLLEESGIVVLRDRLLPLVGWITPNVDELALLLGNPPADAKQVPDQARELKRLAAAQGNPELRIVVTGGHLEPPNDYFLDEGGAGVWIEGVRIETTATHGTGCAFSSALLCQVIRMGELEGKGREAAHRAKMWVAAAMQHAYPIGSGHGPLHHLYEFDTV